MNIRFHLVLTVKLKVLKTEDLDLYADGKDKSRWLTIFWTLLPYYDGFGGHLDFFLWIKSTFVKFYWFESILKLKVVVVWSEPCFVSWIEWSHSQEMGEIHLCYRAWLHWLILCSPSALSHWIYQWFSFERSNYRFRQFRLRVLSNISMPLSTVIATFPSSNKCILALKYKQSLLDDRSDPERGNQQSISLRLQLIINLLCPTSNKQ